MAQKQRSDEEWSIIDLKDEKCLLSKENSNLKIKLKKGSTMKNQIKEAASSVLGGFGKSKEEKVLVDENVRPNEVGISTENPFWNSNFKDNNNEGENKSILMVESSLLSEPEKKNEGDKGKRKPFKALFQKEGNGNIIASDEEKNKSGKKQWGGFDGLKKWMKVEISDDETAPLAAAAEARSNEKSIEAGNHQEWIFQKNPFVGEGGGGPDTKQIKRKLHPNGASSDFFVDKV